MKTLYLLLLAFCATYVQAEDTSSHVFQDGRVKKVKGETQSTLAYKKAKEVCLKSVNAELKGKKLTECIVNYQKEAK